MFSTVACRTRYSARDIPQPTALIPAIGVRHFTAGRSNPPTSVNYYFTRN
jgi:hypothetical protein